MSHLLQMRGLKPLCSTLMVLSLRVASFTDAWIETYKEIIEGRFDVSHLLQMRGLKHTKDVGNQIPYSSHLLQMRGLKLIKRLSRVVLM